MADVEWGELDHQRLKRRASEAFAKAYEKFSGFVPYICQAMGLEKSSCEDITQEVFLFYRDVRARNCRTGSAGSIVSNHPIDPAA